MHRDMGAFESAAAVKTIFSEEELDVIEGEMNILCSKLEKLSYIRAQIFVDGKVRR